MSKQRKRSIATLDDAVLFHDLGRLRIPLQSVKDEVANGGILQIEHSSFSDVGDFSVLYLNNQIIGRLGGY